MVVVVVPSSNRRRRSRRRLQDRPDDVSAPRESVETQDPAGPVDPVLPDPGGSRQNRSGNSQKKKKMKKE